MKAVGATQDVSPLPAGNRRPAAGGDLVERMRAVSRDVAALAATDVDQSARYPRESMTALADAGLLSVALPVDGGGQGASVREVADAVRTLAHGCSSTSMIYAMHQIQVWCLLRHGKTPALDQIVNQIGTEQLLLASATSEVNVGGDVRTSLCSIEVDSGRFHLVKQAPVISYGEFAGAVLATARRSADSPPSDQVLVCCSAPGLRLEPTNEWDALGFRGTCSRGFVLEAEGDVELILTDAYGDISSQTMLPVSHIFWASVWLGIAEAAAMTAHRFVRREAHKRSAGLSNAASRLAELAAVLQQFRGLVDHEIARFEEVADDPDQLGDLAFAAAMNGLKVSSSGLVVDVVTRALLICGMSGYRQDSPFSLGRLLRDAHGAALMVNNDRIIANTAQLLLVSKEI
jgi:acyl-CoA dehydrogenase